MTSVGEHVLCVTTYDCVCVCDEGNMCNATCADIQTNWGRVWWERLSVSMYTYMGLCVTVSG